MADAPDKGTGLNMLWVFIIVGVLLTAWVQGGGPSRAKNEGPVSNSSISSVSFRNSNSNSTDYKQDNLDESQYKNYISLGSGSAQGSYQPNQEYITISAHGNKEPINIGGWVLRNGRDKKKYVVSGNTYQGQSVSAVIPGVGYSLYHPFDVNQNKKTIIALNSGEKAYVITGRLPSVAGIKVFGNFKTNRCLGYLEDDSSYRFYPRLSYRCPSSNDVSGISSLDDVCYNFVRSIRACHAPKDVYVKNYGYCLDQNCKLTSYCRNFVQQNYTFQSCFNSYSEDDDFVAPEWRIFLNRTWELWEDRRETISLYDLKGKLVDEISY